MNNCLNCNNTLYLYFGQCLVECPTGYYQDNSSFQCQNCPQTCLSCSSGNLFYNFIYYLVIWFIILIYCSNKTNEIK